MQRKQLNGDPKGSSLTTKEIIVEIAELFARLAEEIRPVKPVVPADVKQVDATSIMKELAEIKSLLNANKKVLNINEAADFLRMKKSYLYKLTAAGTVPHSKPNGGLLYFDKDELTEWALGSKQMSAAREADLLMRKKPQLVTRANR